MNRPHVVRNGFAFFAPIRGSVGIQAHSDIGIDRVNAGVELAASQASAAVNIFAVCLEHKAEQLIRIVVVVAVVVDMGAVDQGIKFFVSLPVVFDSGQQLTAGAAFFLKDKLFDRSQRVGAGGNAAGLGANAVILGSTLRQIVAGGKAVLKESRNIGYGFAVAMSMFRLLHIWSAQ